MRTLSSGLPRISYGALRSARASLTSVEPDCALVLLGCGTAAPDSDWADAALGAGGATTFLREVAARTDTERSSGTACGTPVAWLGPSRPSSTGSFWVATGVLYRAALAFRDADNARFQPCVPPPLRRCRPRRPRCLRRRHPHMDPRMDPHRLSELRPRRRLRPSPRAGRLAASCAGRRAALLPVGCCRRGSMPSSCLRTRWAGLASRCIPTLISC